MALRLERLLHTVLQGDGGNPLAFRFEKEIPFDTAAVSGRLFHTARHSCFLYAGYFIRLERTLHAT